MQNCTELEDNIKILIEKISQTDEEPKEIRAFFDNFFSKTQTIKNQVIHHWKSLFNLILAALEKHPSIFQQFEQKESESLVFKLKQIFQDFGNHQQIYNEVITRLSTNISIASQFFLMNILVDLSLKEDVKVSWQRLFPIILLSAGSILQKYLKMKQQKVSSSTDRVAADLVIQNNSEKWTQTFFLSLFSKYTPLLDNDQNMRRYFINFGCDLQQALLQSFLMSSLNKQILTVLMFQVSKIFIRYFSATQLVSLFNYTLKQNNLVSPVKNVQIPELYTNVFLINPNGLSYIVKGILSQPHSEFILSEEAFIKCLIPILSESIKRQFPFKHDILDLAEKVILKCQLKPMSDDGFDYPVSLLVANLVASKQNQSQFTNTKIDNILNHIIGWNWPLDRCLNFTNSVYVKRFILEQMNKADKYEYSILNELNPLQSQKQFNQLLIDALIKLQTKSNQEYGWKTQLLGEKRKHQMIDERLK